MKKHIVIPFGICLFLIVVSGFFFYRKYLAQVETCKEMLVGYVTETKTRFDVMVSRVKELPHIAKPLSGESNMLNVNMKEKYAENISMLEQFYIKNHHFIKQISIYNMFGDLFNLYLLDIKDSTFIQDIYKPRNVNTLRSIMGIAVENKSYSIVLPLHLNNVLTGNVAVELDVVSLQKELFKFCFDKGNVWPSSILDEKTVQTLPLNREWVLPYEKDMISGVQNGKSGFLQGKMKGLGASEQVVTYYESMKIPEHCLGIAYSYNITPLISSSLLSFAAVFLVLIAITSTVSYTMNRMIVKNRKALNEKDGKINLLQTVYDNAPVAYIVFRNDSYFTANKYYFNYFDGIAKLDKGKVNYPFSFQKEFEEWDICTFEKNGKEFCLGRRQVTMKLDDDRFAIDAFWDITEMEQRLKEIIRSDIAKSELLSRVCSEVKKTLGGNSDAMALLMQKFSHEENIVYINKSTADLSGIIDVVQDYANIESGRIVFDEIPFNLVNEIKKMTELYQAEAQQKGIELHAEIASSAIRNVVGDPQRFCQIINELLKNAIRFTNEGSIRIVLETTEMQGRKILVKCSVEDTGQGMPREKLKKLFSLDLRAKEEGESVGLGVIITKKLVNMMGGSMRVSSPSPISTDPSAPGMQFSFSIICFSDHLSDKVLDFSSTLSYLLINVLIITTDMQQMNYLSNYLKRKGIHSDIYIYNRDTEELLINKLIIDKNRYQIVVIAAGSSEITFSIAEKINRKDLTEHCLYVLVDAYSLKGNYVKAKALNMDYYFVKSNDMSIYDSIFKTHFSHLSDEGISKAELVRRNLNILIAENNILSQSVAKIIFEKMGYEVDFALNALHLVNQLNQKSYDIIFMDLKFPPSDGFEIAEMLRMKKFKMPIIAMTSTLTKDNIKRIVDRGMDGYLSKPLKPDSIMKILIRWFV